MYTHKHISPKYISTYPFKSPFQRAQKESPSLEQVSEVLPLLNVLPSYFNVGHHLIVTSIYNQCMLSYYKLHGQLLQLDILNHIQKQPITTQTGNFQNDHRSTSFGKLVHREDQKATNSSAWVSWDCAVRRDAFWLREDSQFPASITQRQISKLQIRHTRGPNTTRLTLHIATSGRLEKLTTFPVPIQTFLALSVPANLQLEWALKQNNLSVCAPGSLCYITSSAGQVPARYLH